MIKPTWVKLLEKQRAAERAAGRNPRAYSIVSTSGQGL